MECREDGQQRHDGGLCVVGSEGLDQLQVVLSKTTTWPDPHLLMCVCKCVCARVCVRACTDVEAGDADTYMCSCCPATAQQDS